MNRAIGFSQPIIPYPCHFPRYSADPKEKAQGIRQKWDPVSRRLVDCPIIIPSIPYTITYSRQYDSDFNSSVDYSTIFPLTGFASIFYSYTTADKLLLTITDKYGIDQQTILQKIQVGTTLTLTFVGANTYQYEVIVSDVYPLYLHDINTFEIQFANTFNFDNDTRTTTTTMLLSFNA
jgi:hypothetical protein